MKPGVKKTYSSSKILDGDEEHGDFKHVQMVTISREKSVLNLLRPENTFVTGEKSGVAIDAVQVTPC